MISVIIPVYNAANYLRPLLKSLIIQTYKDMEIIFVDDKSEDDSVEIIRNFQKEDNRIILHQKEHQGVSMARNFGIQKATGKYLRFLDADDTIDMDSMERMVHAMDTDSEVDLVIGNYSDSTGEHYYGSSALQGKVPPEDFLSDFVEYPKTFYYGVVWNKLYKKDIIDGQGIRFPQELDWCEDYIFNLEYYSHCGCVYYLPESIYNYIARDNSITKTYDLYWRDKLKEIERYRCSYTMRVLSGIGSVYAERFGLNCGYMDLIDEINGLVQSDSDSYRDRRKEFKELLNRPEMERILYYENEKRRDYQAAILYQCKKYRLYSLLFLFFVTKDFASRHFVFLKKIWNRFGKKYKFL